MYYLEFIFKHTGMKNTVTSLTTKPKALLKRASLSKP